MREVSLVLRPSMCTPSWKNQREREKGGSGKWAYHQVQQMSVRIPADAMK